jgi:biopolymer transport protein ExbD
MRRLSWSPPRKRGRIEIIPLIDIMFFLLAAFMIVSIAKIKVNSLKVALPTDVPATEREPREDFVSISVNPLGQIQIDKVLITSKEELMGKLAALYAANHDQKILLSADRDTRNGDVMAVLGRVRQAGFQRVAFAIKADSTAPADGATAVPVTGAGPAPATDAGAIPQPTAATPALPAIPAPPAAPALPALPTPPPAAPAAPASPAAAPAPAAH